MFFRLDLFFSEFGERKKWPNCGCNSKKKEYSYQFLNLLDQQKLRKVGPYLNKDNFEVATDTLNKISTLLFEYEQYALQI